mmetsp:Transcript_33011/g.82082  ORF Transcript_33011/g.82082 Transcript_33011/m.82082 type:complete len:200 (+) Transcript_33011:376-975(+)
MLSLKGRPARWAAVINALSSYGKASTCAYAKPASSTSMRATPEASTASHGSSSECWVDVATNASYRTALLGAPPLPSAGFLLPTSAPTLPSAAPNQREGRSPAGPEIGRARTLGWCRNCPTNSIATRRTPFADCPAARPPSLTAAAVPTGSWPALACCACTATHPSARAVTKSARFTDSLAAEPAAVDESATVVVTVER